MRNNLLAESSVAQWLFRLDCCQEGRNDVRVES
jgi:hypothetical protein